VAAEHGRVKKHMIAKIATVVRATSGEDEE
jgi:hypothetical protein